jgi:hypothetical protein
MFPGEVNGYQIGIDEANLHLLGIFLFGKDAKVWWVRLIIADF